MVINRLIKHPKAPALKVKSSNPRDGALFILGQVETSSDDLGTLISHYLSKHFLDRRDLGLFTELVYGVLRQKAFLDWQIDQFSRVKTIKKPVRHILRLALYQLLFLDRIPAYAAVNTAVNFSKGVGGVSAGRLVNALLRNVIRSKEALPYPDPDHRVRFIAITTSHPEWMVRRWLARWGEEKTLFICRSNNETPPMTLRVNRLKTDRNSLADALRNSGGIVQTTDLSPDGLIVKGLSIFSLPAFKRGDFYIQDEGAQLIAYLVDPQAGEMILDFCAAPGGKTTHLVELSEGKAKVVATDINQKRLSLLDENLNRLSTPQITIEEMETALAERSYDKILVDAPCSALGILRRIPEGKWRKKPAILADYATRQIEILEKVLPHLKVGGQLFYVTCSTEPEENEAVAEAFSKNHPEMVLKPPSGRLPPAATRYINSKGYFTTCFNSDSMDRFFAVHWIKGGEG